MYVGNIYRMSNQNLHANCTKGDGDYLFDSPRFPAFQGCNTYFMMEFFDGFCIFGILSLGFPIEISISELFGHFYIRPLCYGGHNVFLTGLASAEARLKLGHKFWV